MGNLNFTINTYKKNNMVSNQLQRGKNCENKNEKNLLNINKSSIIFFLE